MYANKHYAINLVCDVPNAVITECLVPTRTKLSNLESVSGTSKRTDCSTASHCVLILSTVFKKTIKLTKPQKENINFIPIDENKLP